MTLFPLGRASAIGVAILLLAGCGGSSQSAGTIPQGSSAVRETVQHGKSWMLPEAKGEDLIYAVGGCGGSCIISYPKGKFVGAISGYWGNGLSADCSDDNGKRLYFE
jgi:hypothetical protein